MAKLVGRHLQEVCAWKRETARQCASSCSRTPSPARLWGLGRAPPESGAPAPTLVVPDGPGLIVVEVDVPFSVGLGEEGVGQDAPRSVKGQVVPMPVPVWWGVGRGRVTGCWQVGFLPGVCGGVPRPPAHLVKSITMSAWPSCTSVKVSGVTSLHTWRASATVCRTCSRSSCHGNRRILGSTGVVGGLGLARGVVSAPAGCPGCTEGAGMQDTGPVCSEVAHRSLRHVGTPSCGLCALRCLRGSALGGKDPGAPRPPQA